MAGIVNARLIDQGIKLPDAAAPTANYTPYTIANNIVFISSQITMRDGKLEFWATSVMTLMWTSIRQPVFAVLI